MLEATPQSSAHIALLSALANSAAHHGAMHKAYMAILSHLLETQRQHERKTPIFTEEGPQFYAQAYAHNKAFAKPGPYQTVLSQNQEKKFRHWVKQNNIPFDPNANVVDYDMRGYWLNGARGRGSNGHFPDTYKTPYDTTFSNESMYATQNNPFAWRGNDLIDTRSGQLVFGAPVPLANLQSQINPMTTLLHHHPSLGT